MIFSTLISTVVLLVTQAAAHGAVISYLHRLQPRLLPPAIQRQWPDYNPTPTITDAKVKCNGRTSAALTIWSQWTHQQAPVMGWFKIDQMGMTSPPLTGTSWGPRTIPPSLAPGNYLIGHELLALHQANTPQFYAECAQIVVTGGGSAAPSGSYLATIPGYASQNDPGIMIDIYSSSATTYTPPGPAVWKGWICYVLVGVDALDYT
ncbi:hypothetical protein BU16DRAFT_553108 [Lophium mytilinum]|uniref:AA9 family lytic polysaccharide monooxygenase n=1 Tax=Lophium mytilinum TaxID=390894 RepID=A0A6A6QCA7_9PEZI|nr:hypothetical protein BU16DRAFT_553108 [Lophium mytilinum]